MHLELPEPAPGVRILPERLTGFSKLLSGQLPAAFLDRLAASDETKASCLLALMLQKLAGHPVERHTVHCDGDRKVTVAFELYWAPSAIVAGQLAVRISNHLYGYAEAAAADLAERIVQFHLLCAEGPSVDARYLIAEARKRGIPAIHRGRGNLGSVEFGQGIHQRTMVRQLTDRTPSLAVRRATDKTATLKLLAAAGLPTPQHIEVADATGAVAAARKIGFPVVVKPVHTDRGIGIATDLSDIAGVENAYATARRFDDSVAVERHVPGRTFRLLVIGGRFVAASSTEPTLITGDGTSTVRHLVDRINADLSRGPGHLKPLTWLVLDEEAERTLTALSLTQESILEAGRSITLRTMSNLSRGGLSRDVTSRVHEENRRLAQLCAELLSLDFAGIDYRASAIDIPWQESGGAVIEVNCSPGLRMHHSPAIGDGVDVAAAVFSGFYPAGAPSRIPVFAVTGTNGKTTTTRMIAHICSGCGLTTGRATTGELAIGDRIVERGDHAGLRAARHILSLPIVEAAALETARGGIIKYGLGFERCDVAVVLNVEADHIDELGIRNLDELARVKQLVALSADRAVVLNADDPRCLAMAPACTAERRVLFSMSGPGQTIDAHVAQGTVVYHLNDEDGGEVIVRSSREGRETLAAVAALPVTAGGNARHNVQNAIAALAAADQIGLERADILASALSFGREARSNIGRLNFHRGLPFGVLLDYAHNAHGFAAIADYVGRLNVQGRKICVFSMNGTRISDHVARQAAGALASHFDVFVPFVHDLAKKRREGLSEIFRAGLLDAGVPVDRIDPIESEAQAIDAALASAKVGDLVAVLTGADSEMVWQRILAYEPRPDQL
jgi:cyanophycin synthetase